ncbi:hypothetical protein GCM10028803_35960 [Larkinella knui]|uniref:histidine kinase n=1 Tax=Larkinella knui TaxID=2025310 RepID=A0A3P1CDR7_9BACT|nr:PAS domain S-box protein [Larkinella knui]RRB11459.1 PAS domain S-box protein [Larkinella knui]
MDFLDETLRAQQLESFQEVIPVAVLYCVPVFQNDQVVDFRFVWGNRTALELSALTSSEFGLMTMLRLFPHFVDTGIFRRYVQAWETGDNQRFERPHPIKDQIRWVDVTVSKKYDGIIITSLDITESKLIQQELERQSELLKTIVEQLPAGLALFQPVRNAAGEINDFRYVLTNTANARNLGLSAEQLTNRNLLEVYPSAGEQGTLGRLKHVLQTGTPIHYELDYKVNGLTLWIEGHMTRVDDTVLLTYLDNTALKQQQKVLQQQADLLQQKNEELHQSNRALMRTNQRLQGLQAIERALHNRNLTGQEPEIAALLHIRELVPCERLAVFRFDDTTGLAQTERWLVGKEMDARTGSGLPSQLFKIEPLLSGNPWIIDHLQPDSAGIPPEMALYQRGFRSLIVIPLFSQEQYIGAFVLMDYKPHFFTEEHLQIAREVASQLAIVLYQQHLSKQLQQHTEQLEQRVAERTREIGQLSALQNAILKHAGQAIVSTDIHGVVQTANPASEKLMGYRVEELIGKVSHVEFASSDSPIPLISYQPREVARPTSELFGAVLATQNYFHSECIAVGKNGEQVPILLVTSTLQDEEGTIIGYVGIATDISAMKAAEEKLQQKNRELNTFFEGALDMHCISDSQGKISKINQAFQAALDYSETELMAIPFLHLIHPDEQKFVFQNLLSGILQRPVRNQINRFRKKDGSYRTIEWNAVGIDNLVYGSARDITERQQAETQLRNVNQRLQLATQAVGQGIWEDDLVTNQLFWDDRMWEMHGMEPGRSDWTLQEYLKMVHPDDLTNFIRRTHLGTPAERITNMSRIIRPDGSIIYLEYNGLLVKNQEGRSVRVIGVAWDVTQRKQAEDALRDSEQRFREIAENVDEVFWIHSVEPFELLYINPAYERVFGIASPHPRGTHAFLETIVEEDQAAVMIEFEKYRQGQEVTIQCRVKGTHRAARWIDIRTFVMKDSQDNPVRYIGIANDITSQKEKERVLQQSLEREQELSKLKSQVVSTASHEFRTPLTTIQTSVDLIHLFLEQPLETAKPSIQKYLKVIEEQILNFTGLLTDMLTIGRIEAGKVTFNPTWVDVLPLCQGVIASHFSHQADRRSVLVSIDDPSCRAYLDEKLMSHVLVNLLSNAFKFSKGDPRLTISSQDRQLIIQVIDEGIGIPAGDLPALFQTFFRAGNTATIQGTGLGLVIARQFVELHGGTLTVQSEENTGSTFTVVLPIEQNSPALKPV